MKPAPKQIFGSSVGTGPGPPPVETLVSTYVARRELLPVLVEQVLASAGLAFAEAELMLELFGPWKLGWTVPPCDAEGYVTQKALEKVLINSQSYVSRRVGQLTNRGYISIKRAGRTGLLSKAQKVRLSQSARELMGSIWENYQRLAGVILRGVPAEQRLKHYLVCQKVCARIRPVDFLGQTGPSEAPEPAESLRMLFKMARDVCKPLGEEVLAGTNVSLERADFLVILLLAHPAHIGKAASVFPSGFVPLVTIRDSMVHSISPSKFLLSRWLRELESQGLVEEKPLDAKRKAARLTAKGVQSTAPILQKYFELAKDLVGDIASEDRIAHYQTNFAIVRAVQPYGRKDSIRRFDAA